jgi:hypothetical protein
MRYYIKKLQRNELGIKGDGTIARGRFFLISKAALEFFPHLSTTVLNDNVLIPIIPPFSDSKIYSTLVYHNDKFHTPSGSRNETRLYLNRNLDPDRNYFHVDDIVVFEKIETNTFVPTGLTKSPISTYLLFKYSKGDPDYSQLNEIIINSAIKGEHAIVEEDINFIPRRPINPDNADVVIPQEIINEVIIQQEEVFQNEESGIEETRGASLFGPESFRDFVLHAYEFKCAITRTIIAFKNLNNLEAAHIQPKAQAGTFLPCNGIALSRDMHWAFDKGFITIDDEFNVIVHEDMLESPLKHFHKLPIHLPKEPYFQPEKKFLAHHREKIFGLFRYSGSIRREN